MMVALHEIAERLRTQDNRITDAPIFIVEEQRRTYGFDPAYGGPIVWIDTANDSVEASSEEHSRLEGEWDEDGEEPDGWTRTAYKDEWRFVTACFTEAGCAEYIRVNGHNHRGELRIFAAGSWRNDEWRVIRDHLLSIASPDPGIRGQGMSPCAEASVGTTTTSPTTGASAKAG